MRKKINEFLKVSLVVALVAMASISFYPHEATAFQTATVNCKDVEVYGSGDFRDRICGATDCSWEDHDASNNNGTCTIQNGGGVGGL